MSKKLTKTKQEAFFAKYRPDPIGFQVDCLDVNPDYVWDKMIEVAEAVRKHRKVCVYAGHGVSKTYEVARLALWFLFTHKPSTVITTAPSFDQVEKVLWKEINTAHANARIPLGGEITKTKLDIDPKRKWFGYGFATKPDTVTGEATKVQGKHNEYVLIIFDEAAAILPQIWKATESLLNQPNCKMVAIGNPTSATGTFAELEDDPTWHFINISVKGTPNYKEGRQIIPGVSGREYEESMRLKYGEDSNEYKIRVLGRKPEYTAGTFLGRRLAKAEKEGRFHTIRAQHNPLLPVYTFWDTGKQYSACWFAQFKDERVKIIDFYYDGEGKGVAEWGLMLQGKPYKYGGHYSLPDIFEGGANQKAGITGQYTVDIAHNLGIDFEKIEPASKQDQIKTAQDLVDICEFAPEAEEGVAGLKEWRQRKNEALSTPEKPVYYEEAVKNWGRHVGDAFAGLAIQYRYGEIGGKLIGYPVPEEPDLPWENQSQKQDDYALSFDRL